MNESIQALTEGLPLISLLILSLPLGASLIWLLPGEHLARWVALFIALIDLLLAVTILLAFDPGQSGFQFVEQSNWIASLNIHYRVGVDGISVLFLPLTVLLFLGVVLSSWSSTRSMPRLYYTLLLLLESSSLGIFCSLDTVLFFLFWELTLLPLYFLISFWGIGANRRYAAVKYTLFMLAGGIPILFGFILLAFGQAELSGTAPPAGLVFDYETLLNNPLPAEMQTLVFFLLLLGFAFKTPLFPLHTWLPVVAMEGPVAIAALMTGLKLGAYGIIRFVVPMAPAAAQEFHWLLAGLGVMGILYGAVLAIAQTNLRRMLAYASISHVGLVLLGIASFTIQGFQGALFQLLNFTIIAGGLYIMTGFLHHRIGSTDLINLGGVAQSMPLLTAFFLLFGLASMGVPGTNGFPAEFLVLVSALGSHTGAGLAALFGMVLGAGYFLSLYRRAFLGPARSAVVIDALDLRRRELLVASMIAFLVLAIGLYPNSVLETTRVASEAWVAYLLIQ
ncbi:complex I subunit 4 family protein [endosymbiont of Ridgeia piscesae]|jgi:NADH-quinone oxidoreductase subunit M|uniref:NADH-quinone oxidoreductase subunit M n=1 Tax=endosymbiont of Ridgeia piscesae TaxID=54398 RepID=A0A0T5Z008_9GAMM|nr:NADH-quinone oxidoreductase subunit M [endosymbiont of Ridgeia piscesae]KRT56234.1 NADH dehydrogenase subunit M [endosymbiont of Ridgeia piscesae]KRT60220.1 NADH-quinone oxidoreductase subunit M [endosymbiont of Ridgeia piscesae]